MLQTRSHNCDGLIIGKERVLTAGQFIGSSSKQTEEITEILHFIKGSSNPFSIHVGSSNRTSGGSYLKVGQIYQHEKFNPFTDDFNFSFLELTEPLTFGVTIQSIALPSKDLIVEDGIDVQYPEFNQLEL